MTNRLPNADLAVFDIRKIADYCLNPSHPRGRHKARVFREALNLERVDSAWLRDALLAAARSSEASLIGAAELALEPVLADPAGWLRRDENMSGNAQFAARRVVA